VGQISAQHLKEEVRQPALDKRAHAPGRSRRDVQVRGEAFPSVRSIGSPEVAQRTFPRVEPAVCASTEIGQQPLMQARDGNGCWPITTRLELATRRVDPDRHDLCFMVVPEEGNGHTTQVGTVQSLVSVISLSNLVADRLKKRSSHELKVIMLYPLVNSPRQDVVEAVPMRSMMRTQGQR
jgi:hypothetical protein